MTEIRLLAGLLISIGMIFSSGATAKELTDKKMADDALQNILEQYDLVGVSLAVALGDDVIYKGASGCAVIADAGAAKCERALRPDTKVRIASVSKLPLAIVAQELAQEGMLDLDANIADYLGVGFRNPHFSKTAITTRHLLSHTSSIRDQEPYWVHAPGKIDALLKQTQPYATAGDNADYAPGAYFSYANLNSGLAAGVMERVSGERFDRLMAKRLFEPAGLDVGYNWSGVSRKARRKAATLYRSVDGEWVPQTDNEDILAAKGPYFLKEEGVGTDAYLASYSPGDNPTLFSPQGGLRASAVDMLSLLSPLRESDQFVEPVWQANADRTNGDTLNDAILEYGLGVMRINGNEAFMPELTMVGHSGEAYGLFSGAWLLRAADNASLQKSVRIAFAITGARDAWTAGAHPSFSPPEEAIMRLAMGAAGIGETKKHGKAHHDDPRPFDKSRDAQADVEAAFALAQDSGKNVLLVLGANWCHDSRGLAGKFDRPELASVIAKGYERVWVDVGQRDRNLDIARQFGIFELLGTPTILILSPEGELLNRESVHDWKTADSIPYDETLAYFQRFAASPLKDKR
ncbi:MAG: serine hydrolase [Pseudomonadota bacterium]